MNPETIRLVIQQPSLAKYRVPVYRELSRRNGIQLRVYYGARDDLPNVDADGFEAHPVPCWERSVGGRPVYWHRAQWDFATRRHADVLMLTWNVRYSSLVPALLRARAKGVPTILWGHGYSKRERAWRAKIRSKVANLATSLLFYGRHTAQDYIDQGWDPRRIFVAPNCLDQTPIQEARTSWLADPDQLMRFRIEQGLGSGPVVLYVSRFDPDNRLDLLIRATAELIHEYPQLKIIFVGKGESEKSRLQQIAESLDVSDQIRFLGAIYDEMDLAPWFLSANVFCYPANIGLSVLHAFGYGLPVITSDHLESQNPEIEALRHGENGLLYAHGDVSALAGAIRQVIQDRQRTQKMSAAALQTATETFTLTKMVDGMESAVRYCHERRGRRSASTGAKSVDVDKGH